MNEDIAIDGFDAVAYFEKGEAIKGVDSITAAYDGMIWCFSSQDHREMFQSSPDTYVPQYGGYCSWAMAKGKIVAVDPTCWEIIDDKLYLNFSKSIHRRWRRKSEKLIEKADGNWTRVRKALS